MKRGEAMKHGFLLCMTGIPPDSVADCPYSDSKGHRGMMRVTALWVACNQTPAVPAVVDLLLKHGADPRRKVDRARDGLPVECARRHNSIAVVAMCEKAAAALTKREEQEEAQAEKEDAEKKAKLALHSALEAAQAAAEEVSSAGLGRFAEFKTSMTALRGVHGHYASRLGLLELETDLEEVSAKARELEAQFVLATERQQAEAAADLASAELQLGAAMGSGDLAGLKACMARCAHIDERCPGSLRDGVLLVRWSPRDTRRLA